MVTCTCCYDFHFCCQRMRKACIRDQRYQGQLKDGQFTFQLKDENGKVITGYELSSVITITIDGNEIESCGDTCIFVQKGLTPDVDFTTETIKSSSGIFDITSIAAKLNQYKNKFGKARVVVIKSQLGNPIMAFSGDSVYWEIPEDLPKMTKLMIDGKALYIHRANFQIIDKELIE